MKKVHIIGGGTVNHVRAHLALCAPAYGSSAKKIYNHCNNKYYQGEEYEPNLHLTKMAGGTTLETNADIIGLLNELIADNETKMIFMSAAMCDFDGRVQSMDIGNKNMPRLSSRVDKYEMYLTPAPKGINLIRKERKDIFLVGFKTTFGKTNQEQFEAGLKLCKEASCNLVLVNDIKNRENMIITPEEAAYSITKDREQVLKDLVDIAYDRAKGTFTRSTIEDGTPVSWNSDMVPDSLRKVVNYCISQGAYKPFLGSTAGHFAVKIGADEFLTSRRKTNFNNLSEVGLVKVKADGDDSVIAYGSRPSVGGQSQRIIFKEHPEYDCIVHFHCPLKNDHKDNVPVQNQRPYECGSHQCGKNTSDGLKKFGDFSAVMLNNHGPNIVFNKSVNPDVIIDFINNNFDLSRRAGFNFDNN